MNDYLVIDQCSPLETLPFQNISIAPCNKNNERRKITLELPYLETLSALETDLSYSSLLKIKNSALKCPYRNLRHWSLSFLSFLAFLFYVSYLSNCHFSTGRGHKSFLVSHSWYFACIWRLCLWNNTPMNQQQQLSYHIPLLRQCFMMSKSIASWTFTEDFTDKSGNRLEHSVRVKTGFKCQPYLRQTVEPWSFSLVCPTLFSYLLKMMNKNSHVSILWG